MKDDCRRYVEDPELCASHLDECVECGALFGRIDLPARASASVDALPLAPWEGAAYRAWPLATGAALILVALALVLSSIAGTTPLAAVDAAIASLQSARSIVAGFGERLSNAPAGWQAAFVVTWIAVNVLLVRLLRRPPRGVDA